MLSEPAIALTDLALGLAAWLLAFMTSQHPTVGRAWVRMFLWAGAAAIAGFVHHGVVTFSTWATPVSFALVSLVVIVSLWQLCNASVGEVLEVRQSTMRWLLTGTIAAYVALAIVGAPDVNAMMAASGPVMAVIVGTWLIGWRRNHSMARRMLLAFAVMGAAAAVHTLPHDSRLIGLDPISWYHLAQIPGLVAVYWACTTGGQSGEVDESCA